MNLKALLPISLLSLILLPGQAQNTPGGRVPGPPPAMSPEDEAAARERIRAGFTNTPAPQAQPSPGTPAPLSPRPVPLRTPQPAAPGTGAVPAAPAAPGAVPAPGVTPPTAPPGMGQQPPRTAPPEFPTFPTQPAAAPPAVRPLNQPVRQGAAAAGVLGDDMIPAKAIQFNSAPLGQIFSLYSQLTGRTVLRPDALPAQQTITIEVQSDLTRAEAIQALNSVLGLNGISMIPKGEKFVIAQISTTAHLEGAELSQRTPEEIAGSDHFITQIVTLQTIKPSEVAPLFATFTKNPAGIVPIDGSQIIVLRDSASNVRRMLEILERVDIEPETDFRLEVIPIKYGKVGDFIQTFETLVSGGGGGGGQVGGVASPRTTSRTGARPGVGTGPYGTGPQGRQLGIQPQQTQMGMGIPGQPTAAGGAGTFQQRLQQIVSRAASTGGELQLLENARIVADERSNSLLVYASKRDMAMITNIVSRVDVLLAQVLIEAIVLEITLSDDDQFGINMTQNAGRAGNVQGAGSSIASGPNWNDPRNLTDMGSFLTTNGVPPGFSYFGKIGSHWDVALNAIARDERVNVVQRPRIQTSHAVPGSFFIGSTVPYASGISTYPGFTTGGYSSATVQQIQVGTQLDVTPFITPDGLVVMEIFQDISTVERFIEVTPGSNVPQTSSKNASATLSVQDGDTIMLGGFISDLDSLTRRGVPFLKDIPLLGNLFRSRARMNDRRELIILLHVTVLRSPTEAGLHAALERSDLPGVRGAERRFEELNQKRQEDVDREERRRMERQLHR
jgi:general secretion pathway protein D